MGTKRSGNRKHGIYYTNGVKEIRISETDKIPEGYHKGRIRSSVTTAGKIRITDGKSEKYINRGDMIPDGWRPGRLPKLKESCAKIGKKQVGTIWINNGVIEKKIYDNHIPEGFTAGRLPMKDEQKKRCSASHIGKHHSEETRRNISLHSNNNREKAYKTIVNKYGSLDSYYSQLCNKVNEVKVKNHMFNTSKPETEYYKLLCKKYGQGDVLRNYKTTSYPFRCDFYIKSLDLYIELNYHWTHGDHPYGSKPDDDHVLSTWKEKAKVSQFYKQAIDTWTNRDVIKLKCLRDNHLNFKIIYPNEIIEK